MIPMIPMILDILTTTALLYVIAYCCNGMCRSEIGEDGLVVTIFSFIALFAIWT